jgi:hypothetical protein
VECAKTRSRFWSFQSTPKLVVDITENSIGTFEWPLLKELFQKTRNRNRNKTRDKEKEKEGRTCARIKRNSNKEIEKKDVWTSAMLPRVRARVKLFVLERGFKTLNQIQDLFQK